MWMPQQLWFQRSDSMDNRIAQTRCQGLGPRGAWLHMPAHVNARAIIIMAQAMAIWINLAVVRYRAHWREEACADQYDLRKSTDSYYRADEQKSSKRQQPKDILTTSSGGSHWKSHLKGTGNHVCVLSLADPGANTPRLMCTHNAQVHGKWSLGFSTFLAAMRLNTLVDSVACCKDRHVASVNNALVAFLA